MAPNPMRELQPFLGDLFEGRQRNPTGRLRALIAELIDTDDEPLIIEAYTGVLRLTAESWAAVLQCGDLDADDFRDRTNQVLTSVSNSHLSQRLDHLVDPWGEAGLHAFRGFALLLGRSPVRAGVDSLEALLQSARLLIDDVATASIEEDLRGFLTSELSRLIDRIHVARVTGPGPVAASAAQSLGASATLTTSRGPSFKTPWGQRFLRLMFGAAVITDIGLAPLLGTIADASALIQAATAEDGPPVSGFECSWPPLVVRVPTPRELEAGTRRELGPGDPPEDR